MALTTGTDNFVGTSGNDIYTASVVFDITELATTASTFTVADAIAGGAGTDTINLVVSGAQDAAVVIPGASITAVETLNVRNTSAQAVSLNASTVSGLTSFIADRSTGATAVTALATGAAAGAIGDGTVIGGVASFAYATAAAAVTLNVSGGTTGTTTNGSTNSILATAGTATSATINSTGAANRVDTITLSGGTNTVTALTVNAASNLTVATLTAADYAATAALTVSGAATAVSLGATAVGNFKTIDASGLTAGGLTVTGGTNLTSFKGGAGNDVFTTAVYAAPTAGMVNAGTGAADVLVLANVNQLDSAAEASYYTGFDTVRLNGTYVADTLAGITAIQLSGATNSVTALNATQALAVSARADIGATTLTLADATGTNDTLTLTMGTGTTTAAATNAGILTITGFETLNIKTNAGPTATAGANQLTTITGAIVDTSLTKINLTGTAVTMTDVATTKAVTIDASALTGNGTSGLIESGNLVVGSTITGSGVADTFNLGTLGSTYNAGAGDDTINGAAALLNVGAVYNTIDGGAGVDTLNITGAAALTIVDNNLSKISGIEKIVVETTVAANQSITTGGWFDAAFKVAGVDLTTTTTTGTVTIDMTSFTGNAKITATTAGAAAAEGRINIQTGSGNDTVTVTDAAATTTNVISTFGGNDTIVGSLAAETITGGKGADTMTGGGTTANTFAFVAGDSGLPSATNFDTITDFSVVAGNIISLTDAVILTVATTAVAGTASIAATGLASFNAADTTLAQHIVAVENAINLGGVAATGQSAMWQEGADAFLFVSDGVDGVGANDILIKLVGVNTATAAFDTLTDGGTTFTIA